MILIDTVTSYVAENDGREKVNRKTQIKRLIRDYQTRQQLAQLPVHLYQDIGQSQMDIDREVNKLSLLEIAFSCLRHLSKGA